MILSISKSLGIYKCPVCGRDGSLMVRIRKVSNGFSTDIYFVHREGKTTKWCNVDINQLGKDSVAKIQEVVNTLCKEFELRKEYVKKREESLKTIALFIQKRLEKTDDVAKELERMIKILKGLIEVEEFYQKCQKEFTNECSLLDVTDKGWSFNTLIKFIGDYVAPPILSQLESCGIIKTTYHSRRYHYWRVIISLDVLKNVLENLEKKGFTYLQKLLNQYLEETKATNIISKIITYASKNIEELSLVLFTWLITGGTFNLSKHLNLQNEDDFKRINNLMNILKQFINKGQIRITDLPDEFSRNAISTLRTMIVQRFNVKGHKVIEGKRIIKVIDESFKQKLNQAFEITTNFINYLTLKQDRK